MRKLFCLIPLAVVLLCGRYAAAREELRSTDLHALYLQINQESFDGSLPDVEVGRGNLDGDYGRTYYEDGFQIEIDRGITSEAELVGTMEHEACHVATLRELNGEDEHGAKFEECMKRFGRE